MTSPVSLVRDETILFQVRRRRSWSLGMNLTSYIKFLTEFRSLLLYLVSIQFLLCLRGWSNVDEKITDFYTNHRHLERHHKPTSFDQYQKVKTQNCQTIRGPKNRFLSFSDQKPEKTCISDCKGPVTDED